MLIVVDLVDGLSLLVFLRALCSLGVNSADGDGDGLPEEM